MKRKYKIILATYSLAAFFALGLYSFAAHRMLTAYELSARYASARAFEETVLSVDKLSKAAEKSLYATDGAMRNSLCSEIYAEALSAESALSTLPFSNYQLEQLAAFLNYAGDYAYSLGRQDEIDSQQQDMLMQLTERSKEFAAKLREFQSAVNSGELLMDSALQTAANIGMPETEMLSKSMAAYESSLEKQEIPRYEGKYSPKEEKRGGNLSEDEMEALAAEYAGVDAGQLKIEYDYAGEAGRRCYSAGGTMICVSPAGVESLGQTRLVSEIKMSTSQAEKAAQDYLKARGFDNLSLSESSQRGAVQLMSFAATENGVPWEDNYIRVGIAMDDGSVYSFDSRNYTRDKSGAKWLISSEEAAENLSPKLHLQQAEKIIVTKPGGQALGCYKLSCLSEDGRKVAVFVDGSSGKQREIRVLDFW